MKEVSVLLPTRDSMPHVRDHVAMVREWMDLVEEVIVVDSESTDGTAEFLQRELAGPKLRFFNQPPGLYASWNYGVAQARARSTYISTVGDGVDREGLIHLIEVADRHAADVVISPPRFIHRASRNSRNLEWPIHWLIQKARITEPREMSATQAFLITMMFAPSTILGSSASNLYRTEMLQRHGFPTDFGHQGDTAWTLQNALRVRWAVTPRIVSDFVRHDGPAGQKRGSQFALKPRFLQLAIDSWAAFTAGPDGLPDMKPAQDLYLELEAALRELTPLEVELAKLRTGLVPWCLRPKAWRIRKRRNRRRLPLKEIADRVAAVDPPGGEIECLSRETN